MPIGHHDASPSTLRFRRWMRLGKEETDYWLAVKRFLAGRGGSRAEIV